MRPVLLLLVAALSCPLVCYAQDDSCASLTKAIKRTYTFKPSRINEAEQDAKSSEMDKVWNLVKANPIKLTPCLRAALEDPGANAWFRFDGSNLLVEVDPSSSSKALQVLNYNNIDLDDVNLGVWVSTLGFRGAEDFDVSVGAGRWLVYPRAKYFLGAHGGYEVRTLQGAIFLYGSMDEEQATPALTKIVNDLANPGREFAIQILMRQATPEALRALKQINTAGLSGSTQRRLNELLQQPTLITPRSSPKTSRDEFIKAFSDIVNGDGRAFEHLVESVPDGERDLVAVLKPEDIPLVRKVRRRIIARANQHAIEFYDAFTEILMTLVWRPELVK